MLKFEHEIISAVFINHETKTQTFLGQKYLKTINLLAFLCNFFFQEH